MDNQLPSEEKPEKEERKLLDRLSDAIRSRHYSRSMEKTYRFWVKRFVVFHGMRHPTIDEPPDPSLHSSCAQS